MLFKNLFFFKIWRVVFFQFRIWRVKKFSIQNVLFKLCFLDSGWTVTKVVQRTSCWKMTTATCKKFFYECVACFCLTFGIIFLVIAFFMALGFLLGVLTIICTTNWLIQSSLQFRKRLVYKDFILKDFKQSGKP